MSPRKKSTKCNSHLRLAVIINQLIRISTETVTGGNTTLINSATEHVTVDIKRKKCFAYRTVSSSLNCMLAQL